MKTATGRFAGLLFLALTGAAIAAYLALYELGLSSTVWDPFFGAGSETVLRSSVTAALPIPDAVLGLFGYVTEAVLLVAARVASPPVSRWLRVVLGVLATVMALTSVGLIALQALVVGAWCALCIASAVISWAIAAVTIPEAVAEFRTLRALRPAGMSPARRAAHR